MRHHTEEQIDQIDARSSKRLSKELAVNVSVPEILEVSLIEATVPLITKFGFL